MIGGEIEFLIVVCLDAAENDDEEILSRRSDDVRKE